jgi:hypothetical protein
MTGREAANGRDATPRDFKQDLLDILVSEYVTAR